MDPQENGARTDLESRLGSNDQRTRLKAIQEILKSRDASMVEPLIDRLEHEKDPRLLASLVKAIGGLGTSDHLPFLADLLDHDDARIRANVVDALMDLDTPVALPLVMPFLSDPDGRVRANTVIALSKLGEVKLAEVLEGMIRSPQKWMRASAVHAITTLEPGRARSLLGELRNDPEPSIRGRVEKVLDRLDHPVARPARTRPSFSDSDEHEGLAVAPPPPAPSAPEPPATDELEDIIRGRDIEGLTRWVKQLGQGSVEDRFMRSRILAAVGLLGEKSLAPDLRSAIDDPDPRVVANAIRSLATIGDREADERIRPLLSSMSPRIRAEAIQYFSVDPSVSLDQPLGELLRSGDIQSRLAGLYCIAEMERRDLLRLIEELREIPLPRATWELLRDRAEQMDRPDLPQGREVKERVLRLRPPPEPTASGAISIDQPDEPPPPLDAPLRPPDRVMNLVSEKMVVPRRSWQDLIIAGRVTATLTDLLAFTLPPALIFLALDRYAGHVPGAIGISLVLISTMFFLFRDIPAGPGIGKRLLGLKVERERGGSMFGYLLRQAPVFLVPWGLFELREASRHPLGQRPIDLRMGLRVTSVDLPRVKHVVAIWILFALMIACGAYLYQRPSYRTSQDVWENVMVIPRERSTVST